MLTGHGGLLFHTLWGAYELEEQGWCNRVVQLWEPIGSLKWYLIQELNLAYRYSCLKDFNSCVHCIFHCGEWTHCCNCLVCVCVCVCGGGGGGGERSEGGKTRGVGGRGGGGGGQGKKKKERGGARPTTPSHPPRPTARFFA